MIVNNQGLTISSVSESIRGCMKGSCFPPIAAGGVVSGQIDMRLAKRSLDRQAADVLREEILSGRLAPGLRLVEATLAAQLGVSRGTVRAALSELAHEGLVLQVAYTKWMVPELWDEDAWELYTLRGALEGLAARLAAERRTRETLATLEASFASLA